MALIREKKILIKPLITWIIGFIFFTAQAQKIEFLEGKAVSVAFHTSGTDSPSIQVFLAGGDTPLLGSSQKEGDTLRFRPTLPFQPGNKYLAVINAVDTTIFRVRFPDEPPPRVINLYPETAMLPENVLKLYLEFSQPMNANAPYQYIKVLDQNGKGLSPYPILTLQPALWNEDNTILTLWMDPGRIKKDLMRNQVLGKPLKSGQNIRLVVSADWQSQMGMPLSETYQRTYNIGPAATERLNSGTWKVIAPRKGTLSPLIIRFNEILDHQLLQECFSTPLPGTFKVGKGDQSIEFVPETPWVTGNYPVRVESRLEDLAGNNLNRPFDRDVYTQEKAENPAYTFFFTIK